MYPLFILQQRFIVFYFTFYRRRFNEYNIVKITIEFRYKLTLKLMRVDIDNKIQQKGL